MRKLNTDNLFYGEVLIDRLVWIDVDTRGIKREGEKSDDVKLQCKFKAILQITNWRFVFTILGESISKHVIYWDISWMDLMKISSHSNWLQLTLKDNSTISLMNEDPHIASIKLWTFSEALKTEKQSFILGKPMKQPLEIDLVCETLVPHIGNWALLLISFGIICEIDETPKRLDCNNKLSIDIVKEIFSKKNLEKFIIGDEKHAKFILLIASSHKKPLSEIKNLCLRSEQNHTIDKTIFTRKSDNSFFDPQTDLVANIQGCVTKKQLKNISIAPSTPLNVDTKSPTVKSLNDLNKLLNTDYDNDEDSFIKEISLDRSFDQTIKGNQHSESLKNIQTNFEFLLSQLDDTTQPEKVNQVQNLEKWPRTVPATVAVPQDSKTISLSKSEWNLYLEGDCKFKQQKNIFKDLIFTSSVTQNPVCGFNRNPQIFRLGPFDFNNLKKTSVVFSWSILFCILFSIFYYILTWPALAMYCIFAFCFFTTLIYIIKQVVKVPSRQNLPLQNSILLRDFLTQHVTTRRLKKLINNRNIYIRINKTGRIFLPSSDVVRLWPGDIVLLKVVGEQSSFEVPLGFGPAKKLLTSHEIEERRLRWLAEQKAKYR